MASCFWIILPVLLCCRGVEANDALGGTFQQLTSQFGRLQQAIEDLRRAVVGLQTQLNGLMKDVKSEPGTGTNAELDFRQLVPNSKLNPNFTVYALYGEEIAKNIRIGSRVIRGKGWIHGDQDGGGPGTALNWYRNDPGTNQIVVRWDTGRQASYRVGHPGPCDLYLITGGDVDHIKNIPTLRFKPIFKADLQIAIMIGSRVVRGENWIWSEQDGRGPGTVTSWYHNNKTTHQVMVDWDNAGRGNYRVGADDQYDLFLLAD